MGKLAKRVRVVGVPLDLGVSKLGVDMGPTAIRYAGILDALAWAGIEYTDAGDLDVVRNFSLDCLAPAAREAAKLAEIIRVSEALAAETFGAANRGELPLTLGGDHSTSIGAVAGVAKAVGKLGLVWLDAHPDANTPQTSPSGNIHGMPLAIALGHGHEALVRCAGFAPKVRPENVCIVGAKDIDPPERAFLERNGVALFTTFDIEDMGIARVMEQAAAIASRDTDGVYVSFDSDVMDRNLAPGTGIVTRGGLNYREISYVMQFLGANVHLAGLDIIEVNPLMDKGNRTAELCVELAMAALGVKYSDYERTYLARNQPTHCG
ncbi:MAG: arginase [Desulfovibrionaceae bacterium]